MPAETYCRKELLYTLILSLGSVTFGYVMGYPSPAVVEFRSLFPSVPEIQLTFFTSVTSLTAIAGPFITNFLLSARFPLGRRGTVFLLSLSATIFWLISLAISESHFWVGIVSRALLGLTVGGFSAVVPMYIVELSPDEMSAFFGSIHQICVASGFVILYLLSTWLAWDSVAIGGAIITFLLALLVWFVPQPIPITIEPSDAEAKESPFQRKWAPKLILGALLAFFQQLSGINAILVNLHTLFQEANLDLETGIASAIAASAQVIACLIASFVIDSLGRRLVWIISFGGIALTDIVYGITEIDSLKEKVPPAVAIVIIFVNLLAFGGGAGPIPWFIVPELFPDGVRAAAVSIVTACNWIFAFAVVQLFPEMKKGMGLWGVFVLYGVVSLVAAVYGAFFLKKTRKEEELEDAGVPVFEARGSSADHRSARQSGQAGGGYELEEFGGRRSTDPLIDNPETPV